MYHACATSDVILAKCSSKLKMKNQVSTSKMYIGPIPACARMRVCMRECDQIPKRYD